MANKDKFLQRKFLYDLQCAISFLGALLIWFLIIVILIRIFDVNDDFGGNFL